MSDNFLDIELVTKMFGHDWSVREVIEKIKTSELTAYVRIYCEVEDNEDSRYEIAVIKNIKECQHKSKDSSTMWYSVKYFPIETLQDDEYEFHRANIASDKHCGERVFDNLKNNSSHGIFVTVDQICLLHFDVLNFIQKIAKVGAVELYEVGSAENGSAQFVSETPEQLICRLRLDGEQNEVIAVHLHNKFSGLNGYDKMKLINPVKVNNWEQQNGKIGRMRQSFYELKKKGLAILKKREKMTLSEIRDLPS